MFRKGGNVGDGIMTGIVDREMHAESDPNGVGGQSLSTAERLQKAYDKYPDQSIDPIAQLLIQGGATTEQLESVSDEELRNLYLEALQSL